MDKTRKTKRHFVTMTLVSAVFVTAVLCVGIAQGNPNPGADTYTYTYRRSISWRIWDWSNQEYIQITGALHGVEHWTSDGNGGYHYTWRYHTHGSGEGETSGDKYQFSQGESVNFNLHPEAAYEWDGSYTWRLNGQGQAKDRLIQVTYHYTRDANGRVRVNFYNYKIVKDGE